MSQSRLFQSSHNITPSNALVARIFAKIVEDSLSHTRGNDEVWVTDLVGCRQKYVFNKQYASMVMQINTAILKGTIMHAGIEQYLTSIFGDSVTVEERVSKSIIVDGTEFTITGRPDAIIVSGDDRVPVEFKTVKGYSELPFEHHVDQLRIYMWMLGSERGVLIYFIEDEGFKEFTVNGAFRDNDIVAMIKDWKSPRYDWECRYCPFTAACPFSRKR